MVRIVERRGGICCCKDMPFCRNLQTIFGESAYKKGNLTQNFHKILIANYWIFRNLSYPCSVSPRQSSWQCSNRARRFLFIYIWIWPILSPLQNGLNLQKISLICLNREVYWFVIARNWLKSSRLSVGMENGSIMEVITCGMATDHSLPYMFFFVSALYIIGSVQAPQINTYTYVIFYVIT